MEGAGASPAAAAVVAAALVAAPAAAAAGKAACRPRSSARKQSSEHGKVQPGMPRSGTLRLHGVNQNHRAVDCSSKGVTCVPVQGERRCFGGEGTSRAPSVEVGLTDNGQAKRKVHICCAVLL